MYKPSKWKIRLGWWIGSWMGCRFAGLISVMTFTMYRPSWDMDFRFYWSIKLIEEANKEKNHG